MPLPGCTGTGCDSICHQCIELASPIHLVWQNPGRAWSRGPRSLRGRRWEGRRLAQGLTIPPLGYFISRMSPTSKQWSSPVLRPHLSHLNDGASFYLLCQPESRGCSLCPFTPASRQPPVSSLHRWTLLVCLVGRKEVPQAGGLNNRNLLSHSSEG